MISQQLQENALNYLVVFFVSFLSATLLPLGSEGVVVYYASEEEVSVALLWLCATVGNTLGGVTNWLLGKYLIRFESRTWFPVKAASRKVAESFFNKYRKWSLLFTWLPIVGDGLALVSGLLRTSFWWFFPLVFIGKAIRYALVLWGYDVFFGV
ncbi:DedA family protein [Marinomonas sp.]|nr:YqaA family protein [Marinomonas sp.]MDB4837349.1 DedA family protein [Marinomonas sp.]